MSNKKYIKAYRKAVRIALKRDNCKAKRDKCLLLSNKLFKLERLYWQELFTMPVKRKTIDIPMVDFVLLNLDVVIENPTGSTYNLSINDIKTATGLVAGNHDIYETGYPLPTDVETVLVDTTQQRKTVPVLQRIKLKNQDTTGTLPKHVSFSSTDATDYKKITSNRLIDTSYKEIRNRHGKYIGHGLRKPTPRKKSFQEIVRRKTRHGRNLKKRFIVEEKDLIYLFHGQKKGYKATSRKVVKRVKDKHYIHLTRFSKITDYLESITLDFLYDEKIRTSVICSRCNRRATLKQYENRLDCTQCYKKSYKVTTYRIRYFYLDNFTRYELNEKTGVIKKQVETFHGFKTLYHGKLG
jgi:uncharacterized CHY-type Zn-finger protein